MQLLVPDSVALPADLQSRIESANNQITLLGGEVKRLSGLQKKLEKEIDELVLRHGSLEDIFSSRTLQVNSLKDQASALADDVRGKTELLNAIKSESESIEKKKRDFDSEIQSKRLEIDKEKDAFLLQRGVLADREKEIASREVKLSEREKKLTKFINEL